MSGGQLELELLFCGAMTRRLNHGPDAVTPCNCPRVGGVGKPSSEARARRAVFSIDKLFCVARRARGKWRCHAGYYLQSLLDESRFARICSR